MGWLRLLNTPPSRRRRPQNRASMDIHFFMPVSCRAFLKQTGEEKRLDLIICVSSYDSGKWQEGSCFEIAKNPVATKDYGLFTRTKVPSGLSVI
jgi:hypothetical protein